MNHTLTSAVILLLLVLDPLGSLPVYIPTMNAVTAKRRVFVAIRESVIAFLILLAFMLSGNQFLVLMHLTEQSLAVSGGVILIIIAIRMVFGDPSGGLGEFNESHEPFIIPLAVPMLAGPSALATVLMMASRERNLLGTWVLALAIATSISCLVLIGANQIRRIVGDSVVEASQKLMGLVLAAVATEMILSGLKKYFLMQA